MRLLRQLRDAGGTVRLVAGKAVVSGLTGELLALARSEKSRLSMELEREAANIAEMRAICGPGAFAEALDRWDGGATDELMARGMDAVDAALGRPVLEGRALLDAFRTTFSAPDLEPKIPAIIPAAATAQGGLFPGSEGEG